MIRFFRELFCRHDWYTDREKNNEYERKQMEEAMKDGADSIAFSFEHECKKCGKIKWEGTGMMTV